MVDLHAELLRLGRLLPVIYISGESTVAQSIQAMKQGAVEFLIKPFGREELLRAVAASLEKDRQQMQHLIKAARAAQARAQLSPREAQVHELMIKGYNNRENMDAPANLAANGQTVQSRGHAQARSQISL